MPPNENVIVVGVFDEVFELCLDCNKEIKGIIDNVTVGSYMGYPILGSDRDIRQLSENYSDVSIVITQDSPQKRKELYRAYVKAGFCFSLLVHPNAYISPKAKLSEGIILQKFINVSSNCDLGAFVRINTGANIMHDVTIGQFTTIAPNAVLLGNVRVGESCYIGSNATILPGIKTGNDCIVGAGSVVTKDIPNNTVVCGNPAKIILEKAVGRGYLV